MKLVFSFCILLLLLLCGLKSQAQYFENSGFTAYDGNWAGHSYMNAGQFYCDRYGNTFSTYVTHDCLPCSHQYFLTKVGSPSNWVKFIGNDLFGTYYIGIFGDQNNQTYVFGFFDGGFGGTQVSDSLNSLIKLNQTGSVVWAQTVNGSVADVDQDGFAYILSQDSLELYDSTGTELWSRPSGGDNVWAGRNGNYFVKQGNTISKFDAAGTSLWQINISGYSFWYTHGDELYITNSTQMKKLDPFNGSVINTQAIAPGIVNIDSKGYYYTNAGSFITKHDSTGIIWSSKNINSNFRLDSLTNIYFSSGWTSHTPNGTPNPLFVPPGINIQPPPIFDSYYGYETGMYYCKVNQSDSVNFVLTLDTIKGICVEDTTSFNFSYNKYHVSYTLGIFAQLTDSSGQIQYSDNAASSQYSPVRFPVPFFNLADSAIQVQLRNIDNTIQSNVRQVTGSGGVDIPKIVNETSGFFNEYCNPVTLLVEKPGSFSYQWYKRPDIFQAPYTPYSTAYPLIFTGGNYDSYIVETTDTLTGCSAFSPELVAMGVQTINPGFSVPANVCEYDAPINLVYQGVEAITYGNFIHNNYFYPDSAGPGTHMVTVHFTNPGACFDLSDSVKFITVDTCSIKLRTMQVISDDGNFCVGDTILVYFEYDSTYFQPGNVFNVNLFSTIIGTGTSSPVTCVIPQVYSYPSYRIQVSSTSPVYAGTENYEGDIKIGGSVPQLSTEFGSAISCTASGAILNLYGYSVFSSQINWYTPTGNFEDTTFYSSGLMTTSPGNYYAEVEEFGCIRTSNAVLIVDSLSLPSATLTIADSFICSNDSTLIEFITDTLNTVSWEIGNSVFTPADPYHFFVNQTGTYTATIYDPAGCSRSYSVNLTLIPAPVNVLVSSPVSANVCEGDSVTLYTAYNPNLTLEWYADSVLIQSGSKDSIYVNTTGNYYVIVTNQYNCSTSTNSIFVNVEQQPDVNLLTDTFFVCNSGKAEILFDVSGSSPYSVAISNSSNTLWSDSAAVQLSQSVTVPALTSGWYYVSVTKGVCIIPDVDSVFVSIISTPAMYVFISGPPVFCVGDSLLITTTPVPSGFQHSWYINNTLIPGETNSWMYAHVAGQFQSRITKDNCTASSRTLLLSTPCKIAQNSENEDEIFTIYPNPVTEGFYINFKKEITLVNRIEIYDLMGKLVEQKITGAESDNYFMDTKNLTPGFYFVEISLDSGKSYRNTFIKE